MYFRFLVFVLLFFWGVGGRGASLTLRQDHVCVCVCLLCFAEGTLVMVNAV